MVKSLLLLCITVLLIVEIHCVPKKRYAKALDRKVRGNFTDSEWQDLVQSLKPKGDGKPTGTRPQPDYAGVIHKKIPSLIGGNQGYRGMAPWSVYMLLDDQFSCAGALISNKFILTAAHCVYNTTQFQVYMGSQDIAAFEQERVIISTYIAVMHPNYNSDTMDNDIAIITLPVLVTLPTKYINIIRLPKTSDSKKTFAGVSVYAGGWGLTSTDDSNVNTEFYYTKTPVIKTTDCFMFYNVLATHMCISSSATLGFCNGESGGPVVYQEADGKYTVLGVISYATDMCDLDTPAVTTRVTSFLKWISTVTKIAIRA